MSWIAAVLADPDFRKGAAVIGIVLLGALVIILGEIALTCLFPTSKQGQAEALNAAGIATCEDHFPEWDPSDEEIAQFLTDAQNGGDPR